MSRASECDVPVGWLLTDIQARSEHDGEDNPPPPDPDPDQLVLLADPTEDAALLAKRTAPEPVTV